MVNYAAFCKNVDTVFLPGADPDSVIEMAKSSANFTQEEMAILTSLLTHIKTEVVNKRILIKPQFQDYDRTNSCHITAEQFRRVLKELALIPPSEDLF